MNPGSDKALYMLPFDHRQSYVAGMFGFKLPLSAPQHDLVSDSKHLIYEGFMQALAEGVPRQLAGILVDEEFGSDILRDAHRRGIVVALSTERSGTDEFDFEYGSDFGRHIDAFDPNFVKVLVRYNPEGAQELNRRQVKRLKQLSDYCRRNQRRFMFELLVPATQQQLAIEGGDKSAYDQRIRPVLMDRAIRTLQDAGVEPDIWKIEGLDRREDCKRIVNAAQRDGRTGIGCIVLGRAADAEVVSAWLSTAASVGGFIGFAVGRTTFWDAVAGYRAQTLTRAEAATQIARRLREWVDVFERARMPGANGIDSNYGVVP